MIVGVVTVAGPYAAGGAGATKRLSRSRWCGLAGIGLSILAFDQSARAAEANTPVTARRVQTAFDWTGSYIGAHAGFGRGASNAVLTDPATGATSNVFDGMIAGVQAGYNYRLASGLLLGVEADISLPSYLTSNSVVSSIATARSDVTEQCDYVATARGRVGYATGPWLAYATGGLAFAGGRFLDPRAISNSGKGLNTHFGWAAGRGVE